MYNDITSENSLPTKRVVEPSLSEKIGCIILGMILPKPFEGIWCTVWFNLLGVGLTAFMVHEHDTFIADYSTPLKGNIQFGIILALGILFIIAGCISIIFCIKDIKYIWNVMEGTPEDEETLYIPWSWGIKMGLLLAAMQLPVYMIFAWLNS